MCFGNAVQQIPLNIASQMQRRPSRWVFDATKVDLPVPERPPIAITGFLRIQIFKCSLEIASCFGSGGMRLFSGQQLRPFA
jgi:hypothetical protein